MKTYKLVIGLFLVIGISVLALSIHEYRATRDFIKTAYVTEGIIIGYSRAFDRRGHTIKSPIIKFFPFNGDKIVFHPESYNVTENKYRIGDHVEIIYDPENPSHVKINTFWEKWAKLITLLIFVAVFSFTSLVVIYFSVKKKVKRSSLENNGIIIDTTLERVRRCKYLDANGKHPYMIYSKCKKPKSWDKPKRKKVLHFIGEELDYDPKPYIKDKKVYVLIDKDRPENYYVLPPDKIEA